jgi:F-box protein 18 (helicase)
LLDEAQDSNPLTLSILQLHKEKSRIILIGDENQAIYAWRGARNAMQEWKTNYKLPLTESFRFGQKIAEVANFVLASFQDKSPRIRGQNIKDFVGPLKETKPRTFIARTNASLFEKALEMSLKGCKVHFVGTDKKSNWDPTIPYKLDDAKDVYRLWIGDKNGIKNPYLRIYKTYEDLKTAALGPKSTKENDTKDTKQRTNRGDKELESLCRMVEKHKHELPQIIAHIVSSASGPPKSKDKEAVISKGLPTVVLSTAHRAKGLEWDNVEIGDDFCPLQIRDSKSKGSLRLTRPINPNNGEGDYNEEEFNLLYVAITRAKKSLQPNKDLSQLISHPNYKHMFPTNNTAFSEETPPQSTTTPDKTLQTLELEM